MLHFSLNIKRRDNLCKSQMNLNIIIPYVCVYGKTVVYIIITIYIQFMTWEEVLCLMLSILYDEERYKKKKYI
jgi:hypothetical protein